MDVKEREEIVEQPRQRVQDRDVLAERRNGRAEGVKGPKR
jgi:hypothetical protein